MSIAQLSFLCKILTRRKLWLSLLALASVSLCVFFVLDCRRLGLEQDHCELVEMAGLTNSEVRLCRRFRIRRSENTVRERDILSVARLFGVVLPNRGIALDRSQVESLLGEPDFVAEHPGEPISLMYVAPPDAERRSQAVQIMIKDGALLGAGLSGMVPTVSDN